MERKGEIGMKKETQFADEKRMETVPSTSTPGYASNHPSPARLTPLRAL
jgi:hypothetical protein